MKVDKLAPGKYRVTSDDGKTKVVSVSKASLAVMAATVKKYANALKRLADK